MNAMLKILKKYKKRKSKGVDRESSNVDGKNVSVSTASSSFISSDYKNQMLNLR